MALKLSGRALHWVFKVGDRGKTIDFYRNVLGMKVLRHEEFEEGCAATCNGPYNGKWSKTMVGYGSEANHFVVELTYNYEVDKYELGNDFRGITIKSTNAFSNAIDGENNVVVKEADEKRAVVEAPGGYNFIIENEDVAKGDPVQRVSVGVSSLSDSVKYWRDTLGMKQLDGDDNTRCVLEFGSDQAKLVLEEVGGGDGKIDHKTAYGRIAFAVPSKELPGIQSRMETESLGKIQTALVSLDTPGKATVQVVILSDPDSHEICFVGSEAFDELSQVDPNADELLDAAMAKDKSKEWFKKKGIEKGKA